jgi:hypothetical protein
MAQLVLTIIALVPATPLVFFSSLWLFQIHIIDYGIFISMIFGVFGYIGLIMNLFWNKPIKIEIVNFILLLFGFVGFFIFIIFERSGRVLKWVITMEEPDEFLILVSPTLISIILLLIKGKQIKTKK